MISKKELEQLNEQKTKEIAAKYEVYIDEVLKHGYRAFDLSKLKDSKREDIVKHIINLYRGGGWDVKRDVGYDQKENYSWDRLIFS